MWQKCNIIDWLIEFQYIYGQRICSIIYVKLLVTNERLFLDTRYGKMSAQLTRTWLLYNTEKTVNDKTHLRIHYTVFTKHRQSPLLFVFPHFQNGGQVALVETELRYIHLWCWDCLARQYFPRPPTLSILWPLNKPVAVPTSVLYTVEVAWQYVLVYVIRHARAHS